MIVSTIGSHSSLQILHGAKKEGFETAVITESKRLNFYKQFWFIDKILTFESLDQAVSNINLLHDSVFIPHGSLVEYLGMDRVRKINVRIFGNKNIFEWESNQYKKMELLKRSGIKIPTHFESVEDVDRMVIVKLHGAKGGRGYFVARNKAELKNGLKELIEKKLINDINDVIIQEYIIGVPMYFQFFYSPLLNRNEIMGIDIRYETNIDGLRRIPFNSISVKPTFVVVGNIPAVARESLLPKVYEYAENFVKTTKELVPPGMIGPYCLESIVTDEQEIVVFEFSGRIVAGTNLYTNGSPYSWFYWDEPMSMGKRIAREVKLAISKNRLNEVTT
ncbi:MAG: formate--phosphoribosylaminoimidazolecarboxamide ligase [Sulfolobaceae archaeon]